MKLSGGKLSLGYVVAFVSGIIAIWLYNDAQGILAFSHETQHTMHYVAEVLIIPVSIYWAMYATGGWSARSFWFSSRVIPLFAILTVGLLFGFVCIGLFGMAKGFDNPWAVAAFFTATDPIGVGIAISLLPSNLVYIKGMTIQLEQESGWNDGEAMVLFTIVTGSGLLIANAISGLVGLAISIVFGVVIAVFHTRLRDVVRRSQALGVRSEVATVMIVLIPACIVAKVLGASAILTTVVAAVLGNMLSALRVKNLDPAEEHAVHVAWEGLSQLAVFASLGVLGFIIPWAYMFRHASAIIDGGQLILVVAASRAVYVFGKRAVWALVTKKGFGNQYKDVLTPMLNWEAGITRLGVAGLIGIPWFANHGYEYIAAVVASAVVWSLLAIPPTVFTAILAERFGAEKYQAHSWRGLPAWMVDHIRRLPEDVRPEI